MSESDPAVAISVILFFVAVAIFVAAIRKNKKPNTNGKSVRTKDEPDQEVK